jgi:DNA polymerase III epsilon subunit-like protein
LLIHEGQTVLSIDLEFAQTFKKKLKKAAIMEIGMVLVKNLGLPEEQEIKYTKMFNPQVEVSSYATKVTGITNKMIKNLKPIEYFKEEIQEILNLADVLVFHGGAPDITALVNSGFYVDTSKVIDTQELAKHDTREFPGYSLQALANSLKVEYCSEHRALKDASVTMSLYKLLAKKDHPMFQERLANA